MGDGQSSSSSREVFPRAATPKNPECGGLWGVLGLSPFQSPSVQFRCGQGYPPSELSKKHPTFQPVVSALDRLGGTHLLWGTIFKKVTLVLMIN